MSIRDDAVNVRLDRGREVKALRGQPRGDRFYLLAAPRTALFAEGERLEAGAGYLLSASRCELTRKSSGEERSPVAGRF